MSVVGAEPTAGLVHIRKSLLDEIELAKDQSGSEDCSWIGGSEGCEMSDRDFLDEIDSVLV